MEKHIYSFQTICLTLCLLLLNVTTGSTHSVDGVVQKTVVSDLANAIFIEYNTHFDTYTLLSMQPDKDFNGVLDAKERTDFLEYINKRLLPNLSCTLDSKPLDFEEIDRRLILNDAEAATNDLSTQFVWRVSLRQEERAVGGLLRIMDNNFKGGELSQLNYSSNILDKNGPMALERDGRMLVLDLSPQYRSISRLGGGSSNSTLAPQDSGVRGAKANSLIAVFKNHSCLIGLYLLSTILAFMFGVSQALSPVHGLTMVAAYMDPTRRRIVDALWWGVAATITQVFYIFVLGSFAFVLSNSPLPQSFYLWFRTASGLLIFLIGYFMLVRSAIFSTTHNQNDHSNKKVIILGEANSLVPYPTAITILLFACAVNQFVLGMMLILSFTLGVASVFILVGIFTVTKSKYLDKCCPNAKWVKHLPIFTAGFTLLLGIAVGLISLYQSGILVLNI